MLWAWLCLMRHINQLYLIMKVLFVFGISNRSLVAVSTFFNSHASFKAGSFIVVFHILCWHFAFRGSVKESLISQSLRRGYQSCFLLNSLCNRPSKIKMSLLFYFPLQPKVWWIDFWLKRLLALRKQKLHLPLIVSSSFLCPMTSWNVRPWLGKLIFLLLHNIWCCKLWQLFREGADYVPEKRVSIAFCTHATVIHLLLQHQVPNASQLIVPVKS